MLQLTTMKQPKNHIVLIAGPNGSGKSTAAPTLLQGALEVTEFVNADTIAQGLSAFQPEVNAFEAGRIMLKRLRQLTEKKQNVAFESTLATRSFAPWIAELKKSGYAFHMIFLWLSDEDFAIDRVAERVRSGGHNIPEETIRRRYHAGLRNFFELYLNIADSWVIYDNTGADLYAIAYGRDGQEKIVLDEAIWHTIYTKYGRQERT